MIDYDNMNYKNNVDKEKIQIKILSKTDYSLSIKAFPNENDFMNIIFIYESGFKTNIIIPPNKLISELFNIFAKINEFELNKLYFIFNGSKMNNYNQRQIYQVFGKVLVKTVGHFNF